MWKWRKPGRVRYLTSFQTLWEFAFAVTTLDHGTGRSKQASKRTRLTLKHRSITVATPALSDFHFLGISTSTNHVSSIRAHVEVYKKTVWHSVNGGAIGIATSAHPHCWRPRRVGRTRPILAARDPARSGGLARTGSFAGLGA